MPRPCPSSFFHHKGFCHFPVYRQFPYSLGTSVWASYWYLLFCCVTPVSDSAVCYHHHWCCTCVLCSFIALCCSIAFFVVILSVSDSWWILLSATSATVYNQQSMPAKHMYICTVCIVLDLKRDILDFHTKCIVLIHGFVCWMSLFDWTRLSLC